MQALFPFVFIDDLKGWRPPMILERYQPDPGPALNPSQADICRFWHIEGGRPERHSPQVRFVALYHS